MDPSAAKSYAAVAWPIEESGTDQRLNVGKNRRIAGRVQAMAAVIQTLPARVEASSIATHDGLLLDYRHTRSIFSAKAVRRSHTGRTRAEDHDMRLVHHVTAEIWARSLECSDALRRCRISQ